MDRGVWQATVHEVTESDMTEGLNMDTQVQLEMLILSEVGQREKDKYRMISLICRI